MEELLLAHDREDPEHPLRPVLLIVLLFPLWYPMLELTDRLPTCLLPEIGAFGYLVLFVMVWGVPNALRHFRAGSRIVPPAGRMGNGGEGRIEGARLRPITIP